MLESHYKCTVLSYYTKRFDATLWKAILYPTKLHYTELSASHYVKTFYEGTDLGTECSIV